MMDNLFKPKFVNLPYTPVEVKPVSLEAIDTYFDASPVRMLYGGFKSNIREMEETIVYETIVNMGVDVDKGKLLHALAYDRTQYYEGFNAGQKAAQPKWISVEERLPEIENEGSTFKCTETVLGVDKLGYQYVGYFRVFRYDNSFEFVGCDCDAFDRGEFDVTHWIPLPEPPKEDV